MKFAIRNTDDKSRLGLVQEPVATVQIGGMIAHFEIEGRCYEIELGHEMAKELDFAE